MRRCRCLALMLTLLLALSACGGGEEPVSSGPVLWYMDDQPALMWQTAAVGTLHGPALAAQPYEGEVTPEALIAALLSGPAQEGLRSPFPKGVLLREIAWDEEETDCLRVRLSEQYGALTDISLTLADYCIVLTLSQVEGVERVEILSDGHSSSYRSHQILSAEEALLLDELVGAEESG